MFRLPWRLMMWIAEALDRSLLTVPEVNEPLSPPADSGKPPMTGQSDPNAEWTRQIRLALIRSHRDIEARGGAQEWPASGSSDLKPIYPAPERTTAIDRNNSDDE